VHCRDPKWPLRPLEGIPGASGAQDRCSTGLGSSGWWSFRSGVVVGVRSRGAAPGACIRCSTCEAVSVLPRPQTCPPPRHLGPFGMCTARSAKTSKARAVWPVRVPCEPDWRGSREIDLELRTRQKPGEPQRTSQVVLSPRPQSHSLVGGQGGKARLDQKSSDVQLESERPSAVRQEM
jgi:hypothetical protein